jgi:hypothetical protein
MVEGCDVRSTEGRVEPPDAPAVWPLEDIGMYCEDLIVVTAITLRMASAGCCGCAAAR